MRFALLAITLALVLSIFALEAASALAVQERSSLEDILLMLRAGVPDEAVRAYVVAQDLHLAIGAEDIVALREAGAGADLLVFLLQRNGRPGPPVATEGAELLYESDGVRVLRRKDGEGRECIIVTNLDENGRRLDSPPDIAEEAPAEAAVEAPPLPPAREDIELPSTVVPDELRPEPKASPARPSTERRTSRGMVYVGPFYQFVPANLPGPGSPWSPVFQIVPVWRGYLWPVPVYPFAELAPVYPPGFPHPLWRH